MGKVMRSDPALYQSMLGQKVVKSSPKPFKSGQKVNTVKAIVPHAQTGGIGFTFEEDDSVVECWRCLLAPGL